mgnify:CR=1 FL=1
MGALRSLLMSSMDAPARPSCGREPDRLRDDGRLVTEAVLEIRAFTGRSVACTMSRTCASIRSRPIVVVTLSAGEGVAGARRRERLEAEACEQARAVPVSQGFGMMNA